jgi:hypothetical protein
MKTSLLLVGITLLATSTFAQSKPPLESSRAVIEMRQPAQSNFRFHAHFGNACCSSSDFSTPSDDSESPFASFEIVHAHGGPDFQPSSFMTFSQALSLGQQEGSLAPGQQSNAAMVQQMLELFQQVRAAEEQNRADGKSGPVKWADLKSTLDPRDYRRPPSTFMDYSQALALGEQEEAQAQVSNQRPSLGDVAHDQQESKPPEEKAKVVIKQNADGSPVIVQKKPRQ